MNRRANDSVFIKDDLLRRVDGRQHMGVWEFMQLFFPEETNKKQFDCAFKFMKQMLELKSIESNNIKQVVGSDYHTLISVVLPKLEKFGLVRVEGERGKGKKYTVHLEKAFSDRIRFIGLEWFRIYARYGDTYGG
ncbi:Uncharacterised protein [uncultured archaeon]|nr:Uncharacterised protein [uncultured archaeon]